MTLLFIPFLLAKYSDRNVGKLEALKRLKKGKAGIGSSRKKQSHIHKKSLDCMIQISLHDVFNIKVKSFQKFMSNLTLKNM